MTIYQKTILLVEDEKAISFLESKILKNEGYNVIVALTGEKALEIVNQNETIDLILMDINLGIGIDGTETAKEIQKGHDIPIVFVSSNTEKELVNRTEKINSYGYIAKNSGEGVFLASVKQAFKLYERTREYDRIFNFSLDMISISGFDGYFKQLNPAWEKTLGWSPEELSAKPFIEFVHPDDHEKTLKTMNELAEGNSVYTFENRYLCKDNSYKWLSWRVSPLVKEELNFAIARDVSDRKKTDEQLKKSLIEKELLTRELQHRIRDNLNTIYSLLRIESDKLTDKKSKAVFKNAESSIKSMFIIYQKLCEAPNITEIRLDNYIRDLVKEILKTYNIHLNRINFEYNLSELLINFEQAVPFGLLLNELISNSLKYAFPEDVSGTIKVELFNDSENIILNISDDGIGFPKGIDINKLLTGLNLVKMVVEQLEGKMTLNPEKGTEFNIKIPIINN